MKVYHSAAMLLVSPAAKRHAAWNEAVFVRLPFEFLAEIRMCEANDGLSAFGDRLPFQIDHAELGDHIHHVGARGGHDVAGGERKHDAAAALASLFVG